MNTLNSKKNNLSRTYLFKKKKTNTPKSIRNQLIEGLLMLVFGINLILFLNSLPAQFEWYKLSSETWLNIKTGFVLLWAATINIGSAILIVSFILLSVILVLGGLWRLFKVSVLIHTRKNKGKANSNKFRNQYNRQDKY